MTVAEIKGAFEDLPPEEQTKLATWMAERDRAEWDAEMERDFSPGGADSELLGNVRQQIRAGNSRPLSDGAGRL
jgi:hypothetical protein